MCFLDYCTNSACDTYNMEWADGTIFTLPSYIPSSNVYNVFYYAQAIETTGVIGNLRTAGSSTSKRYTMCQVDCSEPQCPRLFPYAMEDGKHCCAHFKKLNNDTLDSKCDGGNIDSSTDPVICCPNAIECPNEYMDCRSNINARGIMSIIKCDNLILSYIPIDFCPAFPEYDRSDNGRAYAT